MKNPLAVDITRVASSEEINCVAGLAEEIWKQHFTPIIGAAQVDYMLEKFQSAEAIGNQLAEGGRYYLASVDREPAGYTGLVLDSESRRMMVSKLYLKQSMRGKGVGKTILDFIEESCASEGLSTLWLTVNRFNTTTINWYQRQGFEVIDEIKKDIGGGFYMDDYIFEKRIG